MSKRTETLHLYRAILRECTYLLDPASRLYMKNYASARFARHRGKCPESLARFRAARHALSVLKRANEGYFHPFSKVLYLTYGRQGKRRRELMNELMKSNGISDVSEGDMLRRQVKEKFVLPEAALARLPRMPEAVFALLKSQAGQSPAEHTRKTPKMSGPELPLRNIWMRQTPFCRIRNISKSWYAKILDKALPPLPATEWHRLEDFISGKTSLPEPVPRRPTGVECESSTQSDAFSSGQDGEADVGYVTLLRDLHIARPPRIPIGAERPHHLTKRYIWRAYERLFLMCPVMTCELPEGRWQVKWGQSKPHRQHSSTENTKLLGYLEENSIGLDTGLPPEDNITTVKDDALPMH